MSFSRTLSLITFSLLAACTKSTVEPTTDTSSLPDKNYKRAFIAPCQTETEEVDTTALENMYCEKLLRSLRKYTDFEYVGTQDSHKFTENSYILKPTITQFQTGSSGWRFGVGLGAGKSSIHVSMNVLDAKTKEQLAKITTVSHSPYTPSFGGVDLGMSAASDAYLLAENSTIKMAHNLKKMVNGSQ